MVPNIFGTILISGSDWQGHNIRFYGDAGIRKPKN
jgi:hypothetical protein